jgi:hypothetical protein
MTAVKRAAQYVLGVAWLIILAGVALAGFAVLVSLPVALIVGFWVLGNAALTYAGVI